MVFASCHDDSFLGSSYYAVITYNDCKDSNDVDIIILAIGINIFIVVGVVDDDDNDRNYVQYVE